MELRNARFKLPTLPERQHRKRKCDTPLTTPERASPRSERLENRLMRMEATRDLPSPAQRKRLEKKQAEIRARRETIYHAVHDSVFDHGCYVSARTFPRQLLAAVMSGEEAKIIELMSDSRMPLEAATTQYAYADDRVPIVEAFASENASLIMTLLRARFEKKQVGVDENLFEPLYRNNTLFLPTTASDDSLALRKYEAPESLQENLLTHLVRRGVPFSIIEKFRPVSLFLDRDEGIALGDGVNEITKKAHAVIGDNDGEFYTAEDYARAAVEALRYGHCILALNLARTKKCFTELTEEIITGTVTKGETFESNGFMYKRSDTAPYFLPIHAAAARGRVDVLLWYHTQYPNALNLKDEEHWLPLHYAAACEDSTALKWILAKGGAAGSHGVSFRTKQGLTALHVAVMAGRVENVKILVSTLEALDRLCLNSDHLELEHRTSLNWKTEEGLSALHLAAKSGNAEIVEALCRHPFVDLNSKTKEGLTPIMIAASRGHLACVEMLAESCSTQVDELDRDTLAHAAINGQAAVVAFLMKSSTIAHDSLDICHNSALYYACAYGWLPIVSMLVEVDSSLLAQQNRKGLTPAVCAFRNGHFGVILWLIRAGLAKFIGKDPTSGEDIQKTVVDWMVDREIGGDGFTRQNKL